MRFTVLDGLGVPRNRISVVLCAALFLLGTSLIPAHGAPYAVLSMLALVAFAVPLPFGDDCGFLYLIASAPLLAWGDALLIGGSAVFLIEGVRRRHSSASVLFLKVTQLVAGVAAAHLAPAALASLGVDPALQLIVTSLAVWTCCAWRGGPSWRGYALAPYLAAGLAYGLIHDARLDLVVTPVLAGVLVLASRPLRRVEAFRGAASAEHAKTVETLGFFVEGRLGAQAHRVRVYAEGLAAALELPGTEVEHLRTACSLYGLGKLAVPERLLFHPARLAEADLARVREQASLGALILGGAGVGDEAAGIVGSYRERWDGSGYPNHLHGRAIPIGGRILGLADAVNALASGRPHRQPLPIDEAVRFVAASAEFDPSLTKILKREYRTWERRCEANPSGPNAGLGSAIETSLQDCLSLDRLVEVLERGLAQPLDIDQVALWVGDGVTVAPGRAAPTTEMRSACPLELDALDNKSVLMFYRRSGSPFRDAEVWAIRELGSIISAAVGRCLRYREARDAALTDPMTGLPNLAGLERRLENLQDGSAVVVCDLNAFKQINDRFGHLTGNRLLQCVARKLVQGCRENDFVARIGGDEFVMLFPGLSEREAEARVNRFRTAVMQGAREACGERLGETDFGTAFGVALYPTDGSTAGALLECADRRMYEDKESATSPQRRRAPLIA